jgi:hypothetical protein
MASYFLRRPVLFVCIEVAVLGLVSAPYSDLMTIHAHEPVDAVRGLAMLAIGIASIVAFFKSLRPTMEAFGSLPARGFLNAVGSCLLISAIWLGCVVMSSAFAGRFTLSHSYASEISLLVAGMILTAGGLVFWSYLVRPGDRAHG